MYTTVTPEQVLRIENLFRDARTIGAFLDATTEATAALHAGDASRDKAAREFNADISAAILKALGGDREFALRQVPDVVLLIDVHAAMTGMMDGFILRRAEQFEPVESVPQLAGEGA